MPPFTKQRMPGSLHVGIFSHIKQNAKATDSVTNNFDNRIDDLSSCVRRNILTVMMLTCCCLVGIVFTLGTTLV